MVGTVIAVIGTSTVETYSTSNRENRLKKATAQIQGGVRCGLHRPLIATITGLAIVGLGGVIATEAAFAAQPTQAVATAAAAAQESGIDAMIQHLHERFRITSAQEPLWEKVAAVMRENASVMTQLAKERAQSSRTHTAVDDLKSYAAISAAHAEGTKKLVPEFQALYDSLSDAQKKAADEEFREHYRTHTGRPGGAR
jgi:esterase/lipase